MQAQSVQPDQHQAIITSQQSLQSIQTLLRAGLGCITYLRNLLPSDNFSESYLTSSGPETLCSQPSMSGDSFSSQGSRRSISGFKIMTVTRGFTEEADKLLDYLENGIFDALQKQYLRSCVFAIYLDDQDPNNIIEAYTFHFSYCRIPGTKESVPVMTLGEEMMGLSLSGSKEAPDPVAEATKKGKTPTLGEVKRSLKALIKNLIQATTQMDALPKRRFATFKLFYHDNAPDDYEPPHFRPGDASKDKWFMTTHHKGEVPERCSVGFVHTGYHGVDVRVASISGYLPSGEDNTAPFWGTADKNTFAVTPLTPVEEATTRAQQKEAQRRDALERRVVWDVDEIGNAEGLGLGIADRKDRSRESNFCHLLHLCWGHMKFAIGSRVRASFFGNTAPIGLRAEDGSINECSLENGVDSTVNVTEAQYAGRPESIPQCISQLTKGGARPGQEVSPTQEIENTQVMQSQSSSANSPSKSQTPTPQARNISFRQNSLCEPSLPSSDVPSAGPETQLLKDLVIASASPLGDDSMMLDMETQQLPGFSSAEEQKSSFDVYDVTTGTPMDADEESRPLDCECGVEAMDCDLCSCDGGCARRFHLWCMGYHSSKDSRIPATFTCFDCRVKADRNWDLIMVHDLYPQMMARFKDLAIQRRGIKIFESHDPDGLSGFTKLIGCDSTVAGQVFKRLEVEGFIGQETRDTDESGFMETKSVSSKRKGKGKSNSKGKPANRRRKLAKPVYVFNQTIKTDGAYQDYFNPDPEVEKRLLGLSDLKPRRMGRKKKDDAMKPINETNNFLPVPIGQVVNRPPISSVALESQTQQEATQYLPSETRSNERKRKTGDNDENAGKSRKRIKISMGLPIDLGD